MGHFSAIIRNGTKAEEESNNVEIFFYKSLIGLLRTLPAAIWCLLGDILYKNDCFLLYFLPKYAA
jgi:hypothetical protein